MLSGIWFTFLYQPVLNALFWIYAHVANQNLGWSVIWLTIFLRVLLLPLSIISEHNVTKQQKIDEEIARLKMVYKNDSIAQKEEIRKMLKKHYVSPWARVIVLVVQVVVFFLLYQVFVWGISGDKVIRILYPWVEFPGVINTHFYGFDIGKHHDYIWSGIVALYVFLSILIEQRSRKTKTESSDAVFLILFPAFMFFFLWFLPMVKALFILTTLIFSDIVKMISKVIFAPNKAHGHGHDDHGGHGGGHDEHH
jgi:YidC/Oxa1 family membrane protein insertase